MSTHPRDRKGLLTSGSIIFNWHSGGLSRSSSLGFGLSEICNSFACKHVLSTFLHIFSVQCSLFSMFCNVPQQSLARSWAEEWIAQDLSFPRTSPSQFLSWSCGPGSFRSPSSLAGSFWALASIAADVVKFRQLKKWKQEPKKRCLGLTGITHPFSWGFLLATETAAAWAGRSKVQSPEDVSLAFTRLICPG